MDIFTTALTKVRTVPIKPEKLRVKSLHKETAAKSVSEDVDHLEEHNLYFVRENSKDSEHGGNSDNEPNDGGSMGQTDEALSANPQVEADEENLLLHKEDITHPKKEHNKPDEGTPHLDIYI